MSAPNGFGASTSASAGVTDDYDAPPAVAQLLARVHLAQRQAQAAIDRTVPYTSRRWGVTAGLLALFMLRIVVCHRWYIVCYALFIYLLNLFLAFLSPRYDMGDLAEQDVEEGEPGLPLSASQAAASFPKGNGAPGAAAGAAGGGGGLMSGVFGGGAGAAGNASGTSDDEFRPFIRRLPEFKFWYSATQATSIALLCTLTEAFDVPVYWPILLLYFCVLFALTMRRQIQHMIKYKYVPFDLGKKKFST